MSLVIPFYSTEEGCEVYHDNSDCQEGNNIEKIYFKMGKGGKRLCDQCDRIKGQLNVTAMTALGNLYLKTGFLPLLLKSDK